MSAILWWPEIYRAFDLSVPVSVGVGVSGSASGPADFGLEVPVGIGMSAAAIGSGEFGLSVPVGVGMRGPVDMDLAVSVSIGMAGSEEYSAVTDLSVPVSIGVAGQFFSGALDLAVPVSVGMAGIPSVTFDSAAVRVWGASGSIDFSWSHTASGVGRAVVVSLAVAPGNSPITINSVTYGGQAMTALVARSFNSTSDSGRRTQQFVLLDPPSGEQTVRVLGDYLANVGSIIAHSASYNHVASYAQAASSHGSGTSRSLTVTNANESDMVVQAFGQYDTGAMSNYSKTQRGNTGSGTYWGRLLTGDSSGDVNGVSFTATGPSDSWSGVSVILRP